MALGLNTGSSGGDYLGICTWDARAGRMFRVDRSQGADGAWASDKVDLTNQNPTFMVDFATLEVGWLAFTATGPAFTLVPLGQALPAKPTPDHKQGMRARIFSPKFFGGLREFAASAKSVIGAMDNLHTDYEAAPEAAAGKMPIVQLTGSTAINTKGPNGNVTSYAPVFKIVSWGDRPADWATPTVAAPKGGARTSAPPAPTTNHVPPPAPKVAPEAVKVEAVGAGAGGLVDEDIPFGPQID